ncbi:MerR family transcriptional regulator [Paenibacillus sp. HW567]|uniref:MerR family transcriptional regulator n=1 Tax=Paenibacillus sp. HW567 TaxID=1034769 RepID=UPI00036E7F38|nr:MerR family transcriptional regulator [Paenibacillus sp. HW567]
MTYTITEVAAIFSLSPHTLRFYDKEGLFPFISRNKSGNRAFTEDDLEWIALVCCLKNTGMQLKEIKHYCDLCKEGSSTAELRRRLLDEHRKLVLEKARELKQNLELITKKISFYDDPDNLALMDELMNVHTQNRENVVPDNNLL